MLLFRVLCLLTVLLSVPSLCASAETPSHNEESVACTDDSQDTRCSHVRTAVSGEPQQQPLRPGDSESGVDSCKTVSGGLAKGSCPTTPTIAGTHKVADSGTMNTSQVSDPGDGDGLAGSGEQQHLESQQRQPGDAVSEPSGTLTGVNQVGGKPGVPGPDNNDGRQENEKNGDQGLRTEETTTGPVISGGADQNNGTQQPAGNGSQSSESSGVSNTDTRDSESNQSGTTEQPQSLDNNQTSQGQNAEAENANGAAKPAEDETTKNNDNTTNNEESTTTTTTTTTLPPELTNNKKGDADSSNSISSSVWARVPLLIVVTLACILVC